MKFLFCVVLASVCLAAAVADPAPSPFAITGELDLGPTWDLADHSTSDKPTELKLSPTLQDGNVGFQSRLFFFPATTDTGNTPFNAQVSVDYAYGTYQLYGSLFEHFMTAKISLGDFADLTDYALSYNSNGFSSLIQGNPIGGYIEGITGGEFALSPLKTLTLAVFVPWDSTGSGSATGNTFNRTDVNVSYNLPKVVKIDAGYGNSYNGDVSGTLIQPDSGVNLFYANASLLNVENLTIGGEFGNYYDVAHSSQVENYLTGTVSYSFPDEKTGDSLTFSDDVFFFLPASGNAVVQEYFSTAYAFSQAFSAADLILDLDVNYASNYPSASDTNPTAFSDPVSLPSEDRNVTISPWVKLNFGEKNHILAVGYAYNYDLSVSKTGYNKLILNGTIYF